MALYLHHAGPRVKFDRAKCMVYLHSMDVFKAVVLGALQGLTEFLPVSSSGHLVVLQKIMGVKRGVVSFDVVVHLGTLLSVVIYFSRDIKKDLLRGRDSLKLLVPVMVAEIPTSIMGLALKSRIESAFSAPFFVGIAFMITGFVLFLTRLAGGRARGIDAKTAFVVGLSQGFALFPGISRSGFTIATAMLLGVEREMSGKFSFYIFIPAVLGACLLELKDLPMGSLLSQFFISGFIVSFLVGLASLSLLMGFVRSGRLHLFSYYLVPLGLAVVLFSL